MNEGNEMSKELNKIMGMVCERERMYYNAAKVDALLAEKDKEIAKLKGDNETLKKQRDDLFTQGTQKAFDLVGEKLRHRATRRALWLARAERAKEHIWHEVNADGSPKDDYTGHDWVLVQLQEFCGFELIPRIAEYRRHLHRWVFIDEDYDTENTHTFRYNREQCKVIGWRFIDFAYYGKKFFVQQEINKNVERKCRSKAKEFGG